MADKTFLSLDKIREKANQIQTRDVYIAEWGGHVRLKQLTNSQLAAYTDDLDADGGKRKRVANLMLVMWCAVNEDGSALFPIEMFDELSQASAGPFNLLAKQALDLNGVTALAEASAKNDSGGGRPAA